MRFWNQRSKKLPKSPAAVRPMDEINREYTDVCMEMGRMQHTIKELQARIDAGCFRIDQLKDEGKKRSELDKKKEEKERDEALAKARVQPNGDESSSGRAQAQATQK